jgi:hypothetical protein
MLTMVESHGKEGQRLLILTHQCLILKDSLFLTRQNRRNVHIYKFWKPVRHGSLNLRRKCVFLSPRIDVLLFIRSYEQSMAVSLVMSKICERSKRKFLRPYPDIYPSLPCLVNPNICRDFSLIGSQALPSAFMSTNITFHPGTDAFDSDARCRDVRANFVYRLSRQ